MSSHSPKPAPKIGIAKCPTGAFSALASRLHKVRRQAAFACACTTRDQDAGPAVKTFSAQHRVQAWNASRHSLVLTDHGVQLRDVYVGPSGLLTGSARVAQEARERAEAEARKQEAERKSFELKQKRQQMEIQIAKIRSDFELEEQGLLRGAHDTELQEKQIVLDRLEMARVRKADLSAAHGNGHA